MIVRKVFHYLRVIFLVFCRIYAPDSECHVTFNNLKNLHCLRLRRGREFVTFETSGQWSVDRTQVLRRREGARKQERMRRREEGKEGKC